MGELFVSSLSYLSQCLLAKLSEALLLKLNLSALPFVFNLTAVSLATIWLNTVGQLRATV